MNPGIRYVAAACLAIGLGLGIWALLPGRLTPLSPPPDPVDPIGREAPPDATVSLATWRTVLMHLDDVYRNPAVATARNTLFQAYVDQMSAADAEPNSSKRTAMRTAATAKLADGISQFQKMLQESSGPDVQRDAALAIVELQYKTDQYSKAIESAKPLLDRLGKDPLKAQVFYYLVESCGLSPGQGEWQKYYEAFREETPFSLFSAFEGLSPFGRLRAAAKTYGTAQDQLDAAQGVLDVAQDMQKRLVAHPEFANTSRPVIEQLKAGAEKEKPG